LIQADCATCSKLNLLSSGFSSRPFSSDLQLMLMNMGRRTGDSEMWLKISNLLMCSELPKGASPARNT
jgi:hypothetical protein